MSQLPSPRAAAPEMPEEGRLLLVLPQKQKSKIGFPYVENWLDYAENFRFSVFCFVCGLFGFDGGGVRREGEG